MAPKRRTRKADAASAGAIETEPLQDAPASPAQVRPPSPFTHFQTLPCLKGSTLEILTAFSFDLQAESFGMPAGDNNIAEVLAAQKGARRRPRDVPAGKGSKLCLPIESTVYGHKTGCSMLGNKTEHTTIHLCHITVYQLLAHCIHFVAMPGCRNHD